MEGLQMFWSLFISNKKINEEKQERDLLLSLEQKAYDARREAIVSARQACEAVTNDLSARLKMKNLETGRQPKIEDNDSIVLPLELLDLHANMRLIFLEIRSEVKLVNRSNERINENIKVIEKQTENIKSIAGKFLELYDLEARVSDITEKEEKNSSQMHTATLTRAIESKSNKYVEVKNESGAKFHSNVIRLNNFPDANTINNDTKNVIPQKEAIRPFLGFNFYCGEGRKPPSLFIENKNRVMERISKTASKPTQQNLVRRNSI
jgi:hypothetical protein